MTRRGAVQARGGVRKKFYTNRTIRGVCREEKSWKDTRRKTINLLSLEGKYEAVARKGGKRGEKN